LHLTRRQRLIETFAERKIEAYLVTALPNIRYLSGFTGSNGVLLLSKSKTILFTDPRYTEQAGRESSTTVRTVKGPLSPAVAAVVSRMRLRRVGFEGQRISWAAHAALQSHVGRRSELVPIDGAIEQARMVKSPEEIAAIRKSVRLNSDALARSLKRFKPGMLELDLSAELDYQMRRLGASGPAFDTIVAAGARTALPHAQPSTVGIDRDQLLLVDMGATVDGYASDMTRVFFTGTPGSRVRKMYRAVLEAQEAAIDAVRPVSYSRAHRRWSSRRRRPARLVPRDLASNGPPPVEPVRSVTPSRMPEILAAHASFPFSSSAAARGLVRIHAVHDTFAFLFALAPHVGDGVIRFPVAHRQNGQHVQEDQRTPWTGPGQ